MILAILKLASLRSAGYGLELYATQLPINQQLTVLFTVLNGVTLAKDDGSVATLVGMVRWQKYEFAQLGLPITTGQALEAIWLKNEVLLLSRIREMIHMSA